MSTDATARLRRLMTVLPIFADATEIPHAELERRTGVNAETLLDDLRALTDRVDEPGGFVESVGIVFEPDRVSVRSSHFQRPVRITLPELCALELGMAVVGAGTPPDERAPIDRARARLRDAIVSAPEAGEDLWAAVPPSVPRGDVVSSIRGATERRTKVRVVYRGGSAIEGSERVIHPYVIVPTHGTWFVLAHCERSDGVRFFRADRIESVEVLTEVFERPPDLSIDDAMRGGKPFHSADPERLVVRYSPRIARWIAEREGVPVADDGSVTIEHPLADVQWAVRHVLQYGPDAEVLSPGRVRDEVVRVLDRVTAGITS